MSGCPAGGNYLTGYSMYAHKLSATTTSFARDDGSGVTFDMPNEACRIQLIIRKNVVCNNLTFYPMLRYDEITDDTYEPYKPSVEERLTALENAILGGI